MRQRRFWIAVTMALCLLLQGCVPIVFPASLPTESAGPESTALPAATETTLTTGVPAATEPPTTEPPTTEPLIPTAPPTDPEDPALIRWQNGGEKDFLPDQPVELVPFSQMEYVRPDTEALYADFEDLAARARAGEKAQTLLEGYYDLYARYISFHSMDTLANIRYSLNTGDSYYKAEYDFCQEETPNLEEKLEILNKAFAASAARKELEALYFGEGYFDQFDDYEVYTNPEYLRLSQEEAALLSEYRDLTADPQIQYQGETLSFDEVMGMEVNSIQDYYRYLGAMEAYYDQYNEQIGDLFIRLVKVRRELAQALDFDTYADYSYQVTYLRDYSPQEGTAFLEGIREHLAPVLEEAEQNTALVYLEAPAATEQQVKAMVASAAKSIGGAVWDAYRFMEAWELCDITKSATKVESSFQTYIYDYEAPFVLVNALGTGEDYTTFAHEFGHFTDSYHNYGANEDLETAETYSQAMEFLALSYAKTLTTRERDTMTKLKLLDALRTFVYQGAYASFEEQVYALDPEELTVEKINSLYAQACKDFGVYEEGFDFYYTKGWIDVIHFFEVPYYIISYCISAETSLQIYELETRQSGDGVAAYFQLLDRPLEAGVRAVMEASGLNSPFREEVLEETGNFFRQRLKLK